MKKRVNEQVWDMIDIDAKVGKLAQSVIERSPDIHSTINGLVSTENNKSGFDTLVEKNGKDSTFEFLIVTEFTDLFSPSVIDRCINRLGA